jgi:predicted Zn-dependent peptidase
VDNQPYGTWWERLPALAFPSDHPFHHSLIGSMEDLTDASLEDIAQFFATYYTPDNAVLSIAGDFDPAEARALVEQFFGPIPRGAGTPPLPPMELPARFGSWKRLVVPDAVMLPRLFLGFRAPVFGDDAHFAVTVLAAILGTGKGSRFQRALVRDREIASEASAFTFDLAKASDLLVADVTARPGISATVLEAEVVREIDRVRADGVTDDEVQRAVALLETALVSALQSAGDRADKLSMFATYFADPGLVNEQTERYQQVTAAQVSSLAREMLGEDNRVSLVYVPAEPVADAPAHVEVGETIGASR